MLEADYLSRERSLKILHVDTGAEMRGGQHQVLLLATATIQRGHDVILLARDGGPLFAAATAANINTQPVELTRILKLSTKSDIVHAHDARAHTMAAMGARRPFVVSRRVAFPVKRSVASHWKYARAARYLAVSAYVASELRLAGVREEKIEIVYDAVGPVNPGHWDPRTTAVALASRDSEKGRDLVAEAATLAGIQVVYSDNLPVDLRQASMFIYITRSEGLGSAALLAMAMGIPVIASRVGGLAEVFEDRVSGLYTCNTTHDIAASMKLMLSGEIDVEDLINNGKRRVEKKFSVDQLAEHTLAAYGRALHV